MLKQTISWIFDRPARALKVYYGGGRKDAITEKCIDCVGTAQEAKQCVCTDCPLWCFRPGATRGEIPEFVPAELELRQLADAKVPEAVREHARKMGASRKGKICPSCKLSTSVCLCHGIGS
jgi:DTW domain-containing protein YfiP